MSIQTAISPCERRITAALLAIVAIAGGCTQSARTPEFTLTTEPWSYRNVEGTALHTDHFDLYTTAGDTMLIEFLPAYLETLYAEYSRLLPPPPGEQKRLTTYLFAAKHQWLSFTKERYPARYDVYSRVQAGGFAAGSVCVIQYLSPRTYTLNVISHEGLHQYLAAHFTERVPAWLNEGLATYFEGFEIAGNKPRFRPENNSIRRNGLRQMLLGRRLIPLRELLGTDAGRVIVNSQGKAVQSYYSQAWALALYLLHGEGGKYREGFQNLMKDLTAGKMNIQAQAARFSADRPADVSRGEAIFRAYITEDLDTFETDLTAYMMDLVGFEGSAPPPLDE